MALLYSDEKSVINREIDVESQPKVSKDDLDRVFELERCTAWISEHQLSRICLQFPDDLLEYSVDIAQHLERKTCKQIFILGDTSYGSCCVDEVAASHVNADGIIHFGHSCLSIVNRLPVLYVFTKKTLDTEKFLDSISNLDQQSQMVILYDTCYAHYFDNTMLPRLAPFSASMSRLSSLPSSSCGPHCMHPADHQITKFGRQYCLQDKEAAVIYVYVCDGEPCRNLENFVMSMPDAPFHQYSPSSHLLSLLPPSRLVRPHLYLAERVRDARRVGILVGTLGVDKYLGAVNHARALCARHAKRSYIISVGKPNVPKLANFPEIDVYVLVSCPEMQLPNAKDFLQPIVQLIDLELALNPARSWDARIQRDFAQLLIGGDEFIPCPDTVTPSMDMSLLSNTVRVNGVHDDTPEVEDCTSLALRGNHSVAVITGREGLTGKSWQGLEPNLGLTPVSKATEGRSGTPSTGYVTPSVEGEGRS